jgi:replicative DNA helicase
MGKSTFAFNLLRNACASVAAPRVPALFVSLEMSQVEIVTNVLCSMARVDSHDLRSGRIKPGDEDLLNMAAEELHTTRIWFETPPSMSITQLRSVARRLHAEHGIRIVFVDYLQLLEGTGTNYRAARHEVVAEISRGLKSLAVELKVPVVALSQLNRNVEERPDHRPRMSDLRESGSVEQDAAVVLLLHREEYYLTPEKLAEKPHLVNKAQVIVAKNRHGPTGEVTLHYDRRIARFEDNT